MEEKLQRGKYEQMLNAMLSGEEAHRIRVKATIDGPRTTRAAEASAALDPIYEESCDSILSLGRLVHVVLRESVALTGYRRYTLAQGNLGRDVLGIVLDHDAVGLVLRTRTVGGVLPERAGAIVLVPWSAMLLVALDEPTPDEIAGTRNDAQ